MRPSSLAREAAALLGDAGGVQGVPITEVIGRHDWTSYQTAMKYQHYTGARDDEPRAL
jgi:hypothetical protein